MLVKFRLLQEQPPDAFCKKLFLERYSQNSEEKTCGRYSILIKLHSHGCKKETLAQVFSFKFSKICKNTFFTEQLRTTASGLLFRSRHRRCSMKNFTKFTGKHLWFVKFSNTPFFTEQLWTTVSGFFVQRY